MLICSQPNVCSPKYSFFLIINYYFDLRIFIVYNPFKLYSHQFSTYKMLMIMHRLYRLDSVHTHIHVGTNHLLFSLGQPNTIRSHDCLRQSLLPSGCIGRCDHFYDSTQQNCQNVQNVQNSPIVSSFVEF